MTTRENSSNRRRPNAFLGLTASGSKEAYQGPEAGDPPTVRCTVPKPHRSRTASRSEYPSTRGKSVLDHPNTTGLVRETLASISSGPITGPPN